MKRKTLAEVKAERDRLRRLIVAWFRESEKCCAEPNQGHVTPHAAELHAEAARLGGKGRPK